MIEIGADLKQNINFLSKEEKDDRDIQIVN
jgi:hypothetical protein